MQHFLFCVFKSLEGESYFNIPYHFTQYTVSLPDDVLCDFDGYATQLVTAERCLTGPGTAFPYVVALEVRDGHPFDADTRAHLMVYKDLSLPDYGLGEDEPRGYRRPRDLFDRWVALQIGRNRAVGRVSKQAIGGSIEWEDLVPRLDRWGVKNTLTLKTGRPLTTIWFPLYSSLISPYREIDSLGRVGRDGVFRELPEQIGDLVLCHASDYRARRRAFVRRAETEKQFFRLIDNAVRVLRDSMSYYEKAMNQFSFLWGDGVVPDIAPTLGAFGQAMGVYFDLGVCLGYLQPEAPNNRTGYDSPEQAAQLYPETFYTIRLGGHNAAVESLIQRLADNYAYGKQNDVMNLYQERALHSYNHFYGFGPAATIYDNWYFLMDWLRTSLNALLTLRVVVLVGEAWRAPNDPKPTEAVYPGGYSGIPVDPFLEPLVVTWFRELKLRDRGDFLSTPKEPNVVVVSLPTVPPPEGHVPFKWDNTIHDDDDDGFYITWYEWIAIVIAAILLLWLLGRFLGKARLAVKEVPKQREALRVAFDRWRKGGTWVHPEISPNEISKYLIEHWNDGLHHWLVPP